MKEYDRSPYDPIENPNGVIQMGLAENQPCLDLILEWIRKNPEASICTAEGAIEFKETALYQDYHGLPRFREGIAKFMAKVRADRVTFDPDRIVMSGGATGAQETLAFCLADRGDAFLVPTPYYAGFDRDLRWRTGVQLVPVPCESSNNFKLTLTALQKAFDKATEAKIRVKGLLITNPSNPLGTILDRETLKALVRFVNEKNIHLVCDEIYAATVFKKPDFISIAEIIEEEDCNRDLIHIVYSLSKDMGLPGFRVGIIYSYNDAVTNCARKMSSFGLVSTQTQHFIASMLSDDAFVEKFIMGSSQKLASRHKDFTEGLAKMGIRSLEGNGGLFLWMDLRRLLKDATFGAEMALWKVIIYDVKLNVSPGSSFHCSEPGWFRVCFANMDDETMQVALERIRTFVSRGKCAKRKCASQLQVSLSFRGLDEIIKSPHLMTPHSPISSPLVRART
ncbi:1-aminocyclopropane-1-carboxylate synthase [Bertholletia excelsa]